MTKSLYGCNNPCCAEERSYPADMLRVYEGRPYCEGCWDYTALAYAPGVDPDDEDADPLRWRDLEPFVPEHEKRIAELERIGEITQDIIEILESRIHEAIEVYAGMEGFIPETAPEAYCLRIIDQMNKALLGGGENG